MSVKLEDTVYLHCGTSSASTGAATDADSLPTATVEEDGTAMGYAPTVTNVAVGLYRITIACTAANGFESGKRYSVYFVATVGGVVGRDGIGAFLVESAVVDDVYGRIGAPAGGSIAADLVVIDNFVDDLESRVIGTIAAGTHNPQTGDSYARLGAPAAGSIAADLVAIDNFVDNLESRVIGTIAAGTHNPQSGDAFARLGAPIGVSISADIDALPTALEIVAALWAKVIDSTRTFGQFTKNVMAIMMGNKSETVDAGVTTETFYAENEVTVQLAGEIDADKTRTIVSEG